MSVVNDPSFVPLWILLAVTGVLLVASAAVIALLVLSHRIQLRRHEEERQETAQTLASVRRELEERSQLLIELEREVARLKRVPKTELLPMMQLAHELRSPLAATQSSLEMILQGYTDSDPALHDEMLTIAQQRAIAMLSRVNDFLRLGAVRFAEIERRPHPVQLVEIMEQLGPEMGVRARWVAVDLYMDIPDSLPRIMATNEEIEHLLSNLINNAIKDTDPGGQVTVSLRGENGKVIGVIKDTGIGIPKEEIPRIFDEFYRSESAKNRSQGTGLGLSIVRRVLDLYGGEIHVESEPGQGSTFTFSFPAIADETRALEAEDSARVGGW
jgi:signal transduction histidine kinase